MCAAVWRGGGQIIQVHICCYDKPHHRECVAVRLFWLVGWLVLLCFGIFFN